MKRILLIDHPQFTSATYYLWQGLKELEAICPDALSVSCYPDLPTHFGEDEYDLRSLAWFQQLSVLVAGSKSHTAELPYGIPAFREGETLTTGDETVMRRGCPWKRFSRNEFPRDEAMIVRELAEGRYDLVVLGNSHRVPTILLARLLERVSMMPPVVYFDAGERDELNEHWIHVFRPNLVFKQILTPEVAARGLSVKIPSYELRMYPLPLSSPIVDDPAATLDGLSVRWLREYSKSSTKMIPVYYALGNTWPERDRVIQAMEDLVARRNLPRVRNCSYTNYNIVMSQSFMAVTMRGSGRDTNHYWEIPLYKTAMVSDGTMGCIHPYPFEDRKTAFFYRSIPELVEVVERNLSDRYETNLVGVAGQRHLETYHSTSARAAFFLDILNQELNFYDRDLSGGLAGFRASKGWDGRPWAGVVV